MPSVNEAQTRKALIIKMIREQKKPLASTLDTYSGDIECIFGAAALAAGRFV